MKLAKKASADIQEGDMTAMIDMVFQLICFFMVVINFSEADQNEAITLPVSEMAKPPEGPLPEPITMHVNRDGNVIIGGDEMPVTALSRYLSRETAALEAKGKTSGDATIIIRGDMRTRTGKIQEIIRECQKNKYERFALRAKEDVKN